MSRERDLMRDELTPRLSGGGGRGDGVGGGVSHSRRLAARLALRPSVRGGRGGERAARIARDVTSRQQRVVVKVRYRLHGRNRTGGGGPRHGSRPGGNLASHLSYLQREGASRDGTVPELFTSTPGETADRGQVTERWMEDPRHYRIVISPEEGHRLADLEALSRHVMSDLSAAVGRTLEWVGVVHENTDQPHVHVVLRGASDGRALVLPRDQVRYGMRASAEAFVTAELGERRPDAVQEALRAQAVAHAVVPLDRVLASMAETAFEASADPSAEGEPRVAAWRRVEVAGFDGPAEVRPHLASRLQHLERMGLARRQGGSAWLMRADTRSLLAQMADRAATRRDLEAALEVHAEAFERWTGRDARGGSAASAVRVEAGLPDDEEADDAAPVEMRVIGRGLTGGGRRGYLLGLSPAGPVYVELPPAATPDLPEGGVVAVGGPSEDAARGASGRGPALRVLMWKNPDAWVQAEGFNRLDFLVLVRRCGGAEPMAWSGEAALVDRRLEVLRDRDALRQQGGRWEIRNEALQGDVAVAEQKTGVRRSPPARSAETPERDDGADLS